jgi:hypothetical protein
MWSGSYSRCLTLSNPRSCPYANNYSQIGGLGFNSGHDSQLAIGILLVILTLVNTICMGPVSYPIVAETPSGRLRYKTIAIGRFSYNVAGVIQNTLTPRMLSEACESIFAPSL